MQEVRSRRETVGQDPDEVRWDLLSRRHGDLPVPNKELVQNLTLC